MAGAKTKRRYTIMYKKSELKENYVTTAITFARLYGIAETLHPWDYLKNEEFIQKIENWTEEFLSLENQDLLKFFEEKISK